MARFRAAAGCPSWIVSAHRVGVGLTTDVDCLLGRQVPAAVAPNSFPHSLWSGQIFVHVVLRFGCVLNSADSLMVRSPTTASTNWVASQTDTSLRRMKAVDNQAVFTEPIAIDRRANND